LLLTRDPPVDRRGPIGHSAFPFVCREQQASEKLFTASLEPSSDKHPGKQRRRPDFIAGTDLSLVSKFTVVSPRDRDCDRYPVLSSMRRSGTASALWWGCPPSNTWASSSIGRRPCSRSRYWCAQRSESARATRRCSVTPSATRSLP